MEVMWPMYEETQMENTDPETHYATLDNKCSIRLNSSATQTPQKTKTRLRFAIETALVLVSVMISLIALVVSVKRDIAGQDEKKDLGTGHISCEKEWIEMMDYCYYFGDKNLSWDDSVAECMRMDSHLVKIESLIENDIIVSQIKTLGDSMSYWIGLNDKQIENYFTWISDKSRTTFRDWAPEEPLNGGRHCVQLWKETEYHWDDDFCSEKKFFICEKPVISVVAQGRLDSLERKIKALENVLCGKEWIFELDNCYFLGRTSLNWTASEMKCREMNASLVTIHSKEENDILVDILKRQGELASNVYIGLRRDVTGLYPREFLWTDNTTMSFTDWRQDEPSWFSNGMIEECVEMRQEFGYLWNDERCSIEKKFLCEKMPLYKGNVL